MKQRVTWNDQQTHKPRLCQDVSTTIPRPNSLKTKMNFQLHTEASPDCLCLCGVCGDLSMLPVGVMSQLLPQKKVSSQLHFHLSVHRTK